MLLIKDKARSTWKAHLPSLPTSFEQRPIPVTYLLSHQEARAIGGPPWKITITHDIDIFGKARLVVLQDTTGSGFV